MKASFVSAVGIATIAWSALMHSDKAVASGIPAGEIRVAIKTDLGSSMPGHRNRNTVSDSVLGNITEGLVAYKEDLSVGASLAEKWEVSKDGMTYRFTLRKGVTFHNGQTLTSADVKWWWDYVMSAKGEYQCRQFYDGSADLKVEAVETPDPLTVVFKLDRPHTPFLAKLAAMNCQFAIVHRDSVNAQGEWIKPVGTGPFQFTEWKKGEFFAMSRYEAYKARSEPLSGAVGRKAALANVRWVVIPDVAAQKAAMMAGQIDLMPVVPDEAVPPKSTKWSRADYPGLGWNVLLIQNRDPLFKDVRMRRALAHAINYDLLAGNASDGRVKPNPSAIPPLSPYYSPVHQRGYKFDPALSRRLLAEAGYKGQPIKLQINKQYPEMYQAGIVMQDMFKKAGLNVELEVLEWAAQLSNYREGKFQLQSFSYSARTDPGLNYLTFTGDKDKKPNLQWDNPAMVELIDKANRESELAERKKIFEQVHLKMIEEVPSVVLFNTPWINVVSSRIEGFKSWYRTRLYNVSIKSKS